MDNERIAQIIDKSIEYLNKHGWTQKTVQNSAGEVCMMAAVSACVDEEVFYISVSKALRKHIGDSPIMYNDAPGRTKEEEEVIATMNATAKELRNAA